MGMHQLSRGMEYVALPADAGGEQAVNGVLGQED